MVVYTLISYRPNLMKYDASYRAWNYASDSAIEITQFTDINKLIVSIANKIFESEFVGSELCEWETSIVIGNLLFSDDDEYMSTLERIMNEASKLASSNITIEKERIAAVHAKAKARELAQDQESERQRDLKEYNRLKEKLQL